MDIVLALGGIGCFLGGCAAVIALLSPRAREIRRLKKEAAIKQLQFHQDWDGRPERRGPLGLIEAAKPGVLERLASMEETSDRLVKTLRGASLLNGKGEKLFETVQRVDKTVEGINERLGVVERGITKNASVLDNMNQDPDPK